jgi:hypothetical protein
MRPVSLARRAAPLVGALALHALGALWVHRMTGARDLDAQHGAAPAELLIELLPAEAPSAKVDQPEAAKPDGTTEQPPALPALASAARAPARTGGQPMPVPSPDLSTAAATPDVGAQTDLAAAGDAAVDPTIARLSPAPVDLGTAPGSWTRWGDFTTAPASSGRSSPSAAAPAPASTSGGLAEALAAQDRSLGLGPSGTVLAAVRDAAGSDAAPWAGTAQLAITVYAQGQIDVALASWTGDRAAWSELTRRVTASLRRKPPRMIASRKGMRWLIELDAHDRTPSGRAVAPSRVGGLVTPPRLQSSEAAKADIAQRNPAIAPPPGAAAEQRPLAPIVDSPGVFMEANGRLGTAAVGVGTFGEVGHGDPGRQVAAGLVAKGNVDIADVFGGTARSVSTRVVSETAF